MLLPSNKYKLNLINHIRIIIINFILSIKYKFILYNNL